MQPELPGSPSEFLLARSFSAFVANVGTLLFPPSPPRRLNGICAFIFFCVFVLSGVPLSSQSEKRPTTDL